MNSILLLPSFVEGLDYKELSPLEGSYKYRFVTLKNIYVNFLHEILPIKYELKFYDKQGRVWLRIKGNQIIISKNYAWDGCTPKKWWGGWWGTPDFKKTHLASLVHDALLQFHQTNHFPWSRHQADLIFRDILTKKRFVFTTMYYCGVLVGTATASEKHNNNIYSELTINPNY